MSRNRLLSLLLFGMCGALTLTNVGCGFSKLARRESTFNEPTIFQASHEAFTSQEVIDPTNSQVVVANHEELAEGAKSKSGWTRWLGGWTETAVSATERIPLPRTDNSWSEKLPNLRDLFGEAKPNGASSTIPISNEIAAEKAQEQLGDF
ncbi:hypothetical protein [Calycomorphotria hydatis]|uniref:Uncharacterized protein n=1 Tax=Calycomorphotria hydatis TaxID=2528027 RepID=A0A517TF58_9PLAN|nr:hypothetical protein [Calycomorphotria hydatis]QDT67009.1 hypothetical protein V22_42810 [Calycomorphotria hydatis]